MKKVCILIGVITGILAGAYIGSGFGIAGGGTAIAATILRSQESGTVFNATFPRIAALPSSTMTPKEPAH